MNSTAAKDLPVKNRVIENADGFDCIVNGRTFGTWRSRAEANAGLATETIRAKQRSDRAKFVEDEFRSAQDDERVENGI